MLKITNLKKTYGTADTVETHALDGIDLEFGDYGFVCVLGASGCGKTTLLNVIGGIDGADNGTVDFNGVEVSGMTEAQRSEYRNRSVGFVFQQGNLLGTLSVLENTALPLELAGLPKAERTAKAEAALRRVGLYEIRHKKPDQLSGGQYQRAAIARAVVGEPEIILADEPTGALDNANGESVMELLKELSASCLVITVTHNERLAEKYASRVVRLSDGKVIGDTPIACGEGGAFGVAAPEPRQSKASRAIALACRNLLGNKLRSAAMSVASGIGILGICIMIAILGGFAVFAENIEKNLLSTVPVSVGMNSYSISDLLASGETDIRIDKLDDEVYVREMLASAYFRVADTGEITDEYVEYIKALDASRYNSIFYDYGANMAAHMFTAAELNSVTLNVSFDYVSTLAGEFSDVANTVLSSIKYFAELPDGRETVDSGYDCVYGKYPTAADELAFVVDENGCVDDYAMALLGYYSMNDVVDFLSGNGKNVKQLWTYEELAAKKFTFFNNDVVYTQNLNGLFTANTSFSQSLRPLTVTDERDGKELKITGVLKQKSGAVYDGLAPGLYYTSALKEYYVANSAGTAIVEQMKASEARGEFINPETGLPVMKNNFSDLLRSYGGNATVGGLEIYAKSVEDKRAIIDYLAAWNTAHPDNKINYADNVSEILSYATNIIDNVAVLLLAVSLLSLIVAAILLSVVYLLSVKTRTKEIGILRCIGASRRTIALMILTEACIVGLVGGIIGTGLSYIALAVCSLLTDGLITAALLAAWQALVGIAACIAVTCLAGIAPALRASRISPAFASKAE